jgi:3'-phosphoadenosine 5'-phosphosulfate sulfotransferase (PAPS reductase)/FAD synthetase
MFDGTFVDKNGDKSLFCLDNYKFLLDAPFKISNQCCHIMKRNISDMFSLRNHIFPLVATMADESYTRRVNWMQYGCDLGNKLKPISFWTEQDIFEYIVRYNLPYSECYGEIVKDKNGKYYTTKCDRTGCMFCLYGIQLERNPNRMERMKETHPKMYDFCMKPVDRGGLGLKDVIDWMNENNTNNNRKRIRY